MNYFKKFVTAFMVAIAFVIFIPSISPMESRISNVEAAVKYKFLQSGTLKMNVGDWKSLSMVDSKNKKIKGKWTINKKYLQKSGNSKTAKLCAKKAGKTTIKVKIGKKTYKKKVVIKKITPGFVDKNGNKVTSVTLDLKGTGFACKDLYFIGAYKWKISSSNNSIAYADMSSKNIGKQYVPVEADGKTGTTYIIATVGSKQYKLKVTVKDSKLNNSSTRSNNNSTEKYITSLSTNNLTLKIGEMKEISMTINTAIDGLSFDCIPDDKVSVRWDDKWINNGATTTLFVTGSAPGNATIYIEALKYDNLVQKIPITIKVIDDTYDRLAKYINENGQIISEGTKAIRFNVGEYVANADNAESVIEYNNDDNRLYFFLFDGDTYIAISCTNNDLNEGIKVFTSIVNGDNSFKGLSGTIYKKQLTDNENYVFALSDMTGIYSAYYDSLSSNMQKMCNAYLHMAIPSWQLHLGQLGMSMNSLGFTSIVNQ